MKSMKNKVIGIAAALLLGVSSQVFATAFGANGGLTAEKGFLVVPFTTTTFSTNSFSLNWGLETLWGVAPYSELFFVVGSTGIGGINYRHDFSTNNSAILNVGVYNTSAAIGYDYASYGDLFNLEAGVLISDEYAALGNLSFSGYIAPSVNIKSTPISIYANFLPSYSLKTGVGFNLNIYPGFLVNLGAQGFNLALTLNNITSSKDFSTGLAFYYYAYFQGK